MFTECPECSTAFRVTAKVLQQAAGRVRCGGCGHAFSALEHLTEDLPGSAARHDAPAQDSDLTSEDKFRETSKQLLRTLDELAGTDEVRIEDTGMEWQVLDEDEDDADDGTAADAPSADEESGLEAMLELDDDADAEFDYDGDAPTQPASADAYGEGNAAEYVTPDDASGDGWDDDVEEFAANDDLPLEVEEELAAIHSELSAESRSGPADLGSQFDLQAEAMGLEISGAHEMPDDDAPTVTASLEEEGIAVEAASTESASTEAAPAECSPTPEDEDETPADAPTVAASPEDEADYGIAAEAAPTEAAASDAVSTEAAPDAADTDQEEPDDADEAAAATAFTPDAEVIEQSMRASEDESAERPEYTASDAVPEMSEEELTINQEIDQQLLAIAKQDQDLRSTIIGLDTSGDETSEDDTSEKLFDENSPDVETIVMEGEAIRGAFEKEREKQRQEAALKRFDKAGNLIDSYITRRAVRGGRRSTDPPSFAAIAGALLLVFGLAGQVIHANRDTLSTFDLFNKSVGQVYRMLGKPVTPEWSITGWQFEATNGSIAEGDDVLTIFSRIGNRSQQPLPYPLVHVSLTDRWEEIIGSAVLEPGEYLGGDQNPNQLVTPGNNFTAVITIDEPSVDATGFKLNVCYRVSPGRVRCATEDFKD